MRSILILMTLLCSLTTLGQQRQSLDDLGSLRLRTDKTGLVTDVHYPNYRIGGGTPPTRAIVDCFILDILDSDNNIDLNLKMSIAQDLLVLEGFSFSNSQKTELLPQIKGSNVVFKVNPGNLYVTSFSVSTQSGEKLEKVIARKMPQTRLGNSLAAVNLLYVRGCRL